MFTINLCLQMRLFIYAIIYMETSSASTWTPLNPILFSCMHWIKNSPHLSRITRPKTTTSIQDTHTTSHIEEVETITEQSSHYYISVSESSLSVIFWSFDYITSQIIDSRPQQCDRSPNSHFYFWYKLSPKIHKQCGSGIIHHTRNFAIPITIKFRFNLLHFQSWTK